MYIITQEDLKKIKLLALKLASIMRNENRLQDLKTLTTKYGDERAELADEIAGSVAWMSELVDVLYYAVCLQIVQPLDDRLDDVFMIAYENHISYELLMKCLYAKYDSRIAHGKDKDTENAAIETVLHNWNAKQG